MATMVMRYFSFFVIRVRASSMETSPKSAHFLVSRGNAGCADAL